MTFSSYSFGLFLLVLATLWTQFPSARKALLFVGNFVFALAISVWTAAAVAALAVFAFVAARAVARRDHPLWYLGIGISGLLFALAVAKTSSGPLAGLGGYAAPLSFSFVVFPLIALLVDVKAGKCLPPALFDCALYAGFFPVLFSGPVQRPENFFPRLAAIREDDPTRARDFVERVSIGIFKKFVLANRLGLVFTQLSRLAGPGQPVLCLLVFHVYAVEVFFDFAGYTDIAIGIGRLFGFRLPENFRQPFLAESPVDWWRRWHISLAQFLRDYLYYPLFFATKNLYLCAAITFLVNGFWHGTGTNFALLGAYWAAMVCLYLFVQDFWESRLPRWARITLTSQIGVGSFVFFLPGGAALAERAFAQAGTFASWPAMRELTIAVLAALAYVPLSRWLRKDRSRFHFGALTAFWLSIALLGLFRSSETFIYSQF